GFDSGIPDGVFGLETQRAVMAFQRREGLTVDGIVGPQTASALAGQPSTSAATGPAFAGFDTSIYPGDDSMAVWKRSSPYEFAGYYLKSPCHSNPSWMGHRGSLAGMGWKVLPIYVGQQVAGVSRCTRNDLTVATGEADGLDAVSKMVSEGFAGGSYVYLDIE